MQKFATLNILLIAAGLCSISEIGKNLYDDSYWQANIQNISMDFAQTFTVQVFCAATIRDRVLYFEGGVESLPTSTTAGHGTYRIAGNFCEAEIFAIFAIKHQLAKFCSRENLLLQKFLADESSTVPSSRRSSKSTES